MSEAEAVNPSDPYQRRAQTYPVLAPREVEAMKAFGSVETLKQGETVFRRGDRTVDFIVILSGSVEIYDETDKGDVHIVTTHGPRQFTGELDMFNDRAILLSARMGEDGEVLRIHRPCFHRMMRTLPDTAETIMRALILRRVGLFMHEQGAATLIGREGSGALLDLERFMRRNGYPLRVMTTENGDAARLMKEHDLSESDLPAVISPNLGHLSKPTRLELAKFLGVAADFAEDELFDVAIVGAGPAGLGAAVYAASEGLKTVVLETLAPGGQAGTSSKIENYLGFPTGVSGQALAGRAQVQAQKFGAVLAIASTAHRLCCKERPFGLTLDCGHRIRARSVIVASGAEYNRLSVDGFEPYEGQNIHYAATAIEARLCGNRDVIVIGGGNSAGQAAVFLAQHANHVYMLVRGPELAASMSDYLVGRIKASPKITLCQNTELCQIEGDDALRRAGWRDRATGEITWKDVAHIFVMIGASPNTGWLDGCLALDEHGFVLTGRTAEANAACRRPPHPFESSEAGIFAVGDVRAGSVKRVASGVGEGSVCVSDVHKVLAELYSSAGSE